MLVLPVLLELIQQDGIDVRGTIVADAFVCAGVCTFSGTTTFADITFNRAIIGVGTITDRLDMSGANTNIIVGGATTLVASGGITTTGGDLYIGGNLFADGDFNIDDLVANDGTFTGRLNVTGDVGISSDFSIGGLTTSQTIRPATDSTYDLGTTSLRYANIYGDSATIAQTVINSTGVRVGSLVMHTSSMESVL